jgi:ubiquinol-cytochrome c reductase cytochrome c1 subunit
MRRLSFTSGFAALLALGLAAAMTPVRADEGGAEGGKAINTSSTSWGFRGPLGTYDRAALQRGFQVYEQACAACHSIRDLRFGDLEGIGLSPHQAAAVASTAMVPGGVDAMGLPILRPGVPADRFPNPFLTPQAARAANYGAYPPDLSLIVPQRAFVPMSPGGVTYLDDLLTSYGDAPPGVTLFPNRSYNTAFPGNQIAMANPLHDGQMTFADGTKATVPEMSHDVTTFLAWAADPTVEERRGDGVRVVLFLGFLAFLTLLFKRRIWSALPHAEPDHG